MTERILNCDASGRLTDRSFLADPALARLLALLNRDGEEARVVGGAVRNALLGLTPGDIDVTTTARPEVVMERARVAKFRTVPTGLAHGTVTVVVAGRPFEVTTLREDVETDGRHAVVRFGRDFAADALRRDFTINALSVSTDERIHDYAGGLSDLSAGRVRFIGEPTQRIREDYLRILRFFRFSASYAVGGLDGTGLEAARKERAGITHLSRERIRSELFKLLQAPRAADAVQAMQRAELLDLTLGVPSRPDRFRRLAEIVGCRNEPVDPLVGLAALAADEELAPGRLRESLRLSNEERDRLLRFAANLAGPVPSSPPDAHAISALLFAEGRQAAADIVTLSHVRSGAPPDDAGWQAAARFVAIATVPRLSVSGADIIARGINSGPLVGRVLKELQALWIRAGFPDSPALLHRLLDEAITSAGRQDPTV